jgi:hypothetical protein
MKKFVIERNFPGASNLSAAELQAISQTSCEALSKLDQPYTWVNSYIAEDKIYCIHIAEDKEAIREHSRIAKFPINIISEVKMVIDPATSTALQIA